MTAPRRVFLFDLGAVFAATEQDAERFATEHGMWDRRADGTWGCAASEAHAELERDHLAAVRALAGEGEWPYANPWDERPGGRS